MLETDRPQEHMRRIHPADRGLIRTPGGWSKQRRAMRLSLVWLFGAACAAGTQWDESDAVLTPLGDAYLEVTNLHPHNVDIVLRNLQDTQIPLGTVRVQANRRLTLPRTLNGTRVELILRCVQTGETYTTRRIEWGPASRVTLAIPDLLPLARLAQR